MFTQNPFLIPFVLASLFVGLTASRADDDSVEYRRDIKPLLKTRCYACHGGREQQANLRLDTGEFMRRGGDSGAVFVSGQPAASLLVERVAAEGEDERMPPEGEPLTKQQIELLSRWIEQGARSPAEEEPDADPREHWAFKAPLMPAVPNVSEPGFVRNEIDHFVVHRLEQKRVAPSPPAEPSVLIRRLYLDLLGLPPAPMEIDAFLNDARPDAWERLVDRVIASPAFGERWGRHWLDLARYADSNGYEDDRLRPDAWRFREWVIKACNKDMPFDQFTIAQLAGDLLPDASYEDRVAAGFHRMTLSNEGGADSVEEEFRVIAVKDRTDTTGSVWMGLSVGCAKCHSHKYDPISQREYYGLFAFFNNAEKTSIPAPPLSDRYTDQYKNDLAAWTKVVASARTRLEKYEQRVLPRKILAWEKREDVSTERLSVIRDLLATPVAKRGTKDQLKLGNLIAPLDPDYSVAMGNELLNSGNNRPLPPSTSAITFTVKQRPSHVHVRGSFLKLGEPVQPSTPEFLPPLSYRAEQPDRLDLARWIVDPRNPLTSRVAVNRIWQHLFGRGLVGTPDVFGTTAEPPSHPDLLDWLATEYLRRGWSRKAMIRLIVNSATYRQSSRVRSELVASDPDNRLLARQRRMRLEAECIRDTALAAAGILDLQQGGPSFQPPLPAGLTSQQALASEQLMVPSGVADRYRRGVYINAQRMFMLPMLQSFDVADANSTCARREKSNTPIQALTMLNDPVFFEAAQALGRRVVVECAGDSSDRIRFAFRLCLGREPDSDEVQTLLQLHARHMRFFANDASEMIAALGEGDAPTDADPADLAAWIGVARTLLNVDEFITRE